MILALLFAALAAAACGSSATATGGNSHTSSAASARARAVAFSGPESTLPGSYPKPSATHLTIGYLNPSGAQESLLALQAGFEKEVHQFGAHVVEYDARLSIDRQVTEFQTLISDKVSAIAVYPLDPRALGPVVKQANRAGIPVVGLGITESVTQPATGVASQVWLRPDYTAYLIAKGMAAASPGARVGVIGFAGPMAYIRSIVARYQYWARLFGLHVLGEGDNTSDSIEGGQTAMNGLLARFPNMNGVFAYNDDSAIGAYTAARTEGRQQGITIFANNGASDGIGAVRAKRITATYQFAAPQTGALLADAALDAAEKVKVPAAVGIPAPTEVSSATVGSIKTWAQQLRASP